MSWNSYIDAVNGYYGGASKVFLGGLDGSMWTTADNANALNLDAAEAACIAKCLKESDMTPFQCKGVHVAGEKFQFLKHDPDQKLVLAKKKDHGFISIACASKCYIIAKGNEGEQQGALNQAVCKTTEYLQSVGY